MIALQSWKRVATDWPELMNGINVQMRVLLCRTVFSAMDLWPIDSYDATQLSSL